MRGVLPGAVTGATLSAGVESSMNEPSRRIIAVGDQPINLTQVLKLAGVVQSGGEAKVLIAGGQVRVNGELEHRRRRQMKAGDTVELEDGPTLVLSESGRRPE